MVKIAVQREGFCECDSHTVHKLTQRRLTADWLAPRESECSQMYNKVSSDWLSSYIKATRPVLEIFKMVGYFPDIPCTMNSTDSRQNTHKARHFFTSWAFASQGRPCCVRSIHHKPIWISKGLRNQKANWQNRLPPLAKSQSHLQHTTVFSKLGCSTGHPCSYYHAIQWPVNFN